MFFADFALDERILQALNTLNFQAPSAVQAKAIPIILSGQDLIALAKTGSGKTAASAIPLCHKIDTESKMLQVLVIVPTRELALQYAAEAHKIGRYRGIKTFAICGGEDASIQEAKLRDGVHFLVATPGRLIDFIYARMIDLTHVQTVVLDEADEMLSMGFVEDLEFIIQCLAHPHQTVLFSATMPPAIRKIASSYLKAPQEIALTPEESTPTQIDHKFLFCHHMDRNEELLQALKTLPIKQAIVFCHSRIQVDQVTRFLQRHMADVDMLHAGFSQQLRTIITRKFRSGKIKVLVATDVVARGLDFSSVSHVLIYQLSQDVDIYIHRSGRTGRFGKQGEVITLVTARELGVVRQIEQRLGQPLVWLGEAPSPQVVPRRVGGPRGRRRS